MPPPSHYVEQVLAGEDAPSSTRVLLILALSCVGLGGTERAALLLLMSEVVPTPSDDERTLVRCTGPSGGGLATSSVYALSNSVGCACALRISIFIWGSRTPSRVRFFDWLLAQLRVHMRDVLLRKHIIEASGPGCPSARTSLR